MEQKMKGFVIFDSNYGNTEKIAKAIAAKLRKEVKAIRVSDVQVKDLLDVDILIAGCPVIGWNISEKMGLFFQSWKRMPLWE